MSRVGLLPRLLGVVLGLVLGVAYIGFTILGWHLTGSSYQVGVDLPRAAGVFASSEVTYRGVKVGTVRSLGVTPTGVHLVLDIRGHDRIPADSHAEVRELSALGESYVDLEPPAQATSTGFLHDGSTIARADTAVPLPVGDALQSASRLAASLDPQDLATIETLLSQGFGGSGPDLRNVVDGGRRFTDSLIAARRQTRHLILDGQTVLGTASATRGDLAQTLAAFDRLSAQLKASDVDVRQLLDQGGASAATIEGLVRTQSGPFRTLLSSTGQIARAFSANQRPVRTLFAILPGVATKLSKVARDGQVHGALAINVGQPVCSFGALPLPGHGSGGGGSCAPGHQLLQRGPRR